jgi:hypothetical protein
VPTKQDFEEEEEEEEERSSSPEDGASPLDLIGHDPISMKQVINPPKSILKQSGGMAPIISEPEVKLEITGTHINPATFSQPQMAKEPFVIANPFLSPPISSAEALIDPPPVGQIPVHAQLEQPVTSAEVINAINVFENADIRVIKLA